MINLIVENIKYDNNKIVDFTLSTTGNEDIHWGPPNKYVLLHDFQNSDHFKLVSIDHCIRGQVSKDNLFYVLNVSVLEDFTMDNFFGTIPEKSLKYIRENNIPIMLFSPYESIAYGFSYETAHDAQICVRLKEQLKNLGLENNEIVLFSLASYYDTQTGQQKTFESINKNLKNFSWVQSILFLQPHPNNARSHLEITLDDQINSINNKNKLFLCLNRQPRANRSLLLQSLYINDLWKNNIISCRFNLNADGAIHDFVSLLNMHREKNQDDIINHLSKGKNYYVTHKLLTHINYENSLWKFLCKLYSSLFNKNTYQLTLLNEKENLTAWNFEWEKNWYYDTYFSLITETFYYDDFEIIMITEKTFKPLLNFHPFIIFGNAWYNRSLKNLGFITYENIFFDLPEDGYPGNITFFERLHNIVESIQKLNQLSKSELDEKFRSVLDTLRHNYNHLHNTDWIKVQHDLLINRIK